MAQIRAMGGGPAQFTINTGNPALSVSQVDVGFFYQDDWRLKPNFTLSLGARYETQNNIHDQPISLPASVSRGLPAAALRAACFHVPSSWSAAESVCSTTASATTSHCSSCATRAGINRASR